MESSARYLIGIDLGTTNSVVAFADRREITAGIRVFEIEQVAGPGEIRRLPALPSFLYFPTDAERDSGAFNLPWEDKPSYIVGHAARDLGALVPGRQVSSAKSWLCQQALDRTADILPREAEPPEPRISPVEASARYLEHLRDAWNHSMASGPDADPNSRFERQQIVLTVPASFDEEARELTVEAAHQAGIEHLTLLEEPLAAFYAWVSEHQQNLVGQVRDGDLVLICDIGGGTSDFSLIRARVLGDQVNFERTAIGEHLLLGGENLDLALARRVEQQINANLTIRQRRALQIACSAAKERLLSNQDVDRLPIGILGSGRAVVGQMLQCELTRDAVVELLMNGFLPLTAPGEMPVHSHCVGLREVGLPYASDPAITRHLAEFLRNAAVASKATGGGTRVGLMQPDAILFNGGFCIPEVARRRIVQAVGAWFGGEQFQPRILNTSEMSSAVAIGAAYYARVRQGDGLRVKAGSARTYYIGMRSDNVPKAICVLPAGTDEGTTLRLSERDFSVLANRPVSFNLFSSTVRHDQHGEVTEVQADEMHRHAPLVTQLRYGKRLQQMELAIRMSVTFTEVGTLELWCESVSSPHRWRLQFELRGAGEAQPERTGATSAPATSISEAALQPVLDRIRATFSPPAGADNTADPATLVGDVESILDLKRDSWTVTTVRALADELLLRAEGRKLSAKHETRWLNLLGFCLRPGFGNPDDPARMTQMRRIYQAGLSFRENLQNQVDWLVLWRRISGGLAAAQQNELRNYLGTLGIGKAPRKGTRLNAQVEREGWRLLASLETLSGASRAALGNELLRKLKKEPDESAWLWSLGRFGVRVPLYGTLACVVSRETAEEWVTTIVDANELSPEATAAVSQMARLTGDRSRDLDEAVRQKAISRLRPLQPAEEQLLMSLQSVVVPGRPEVARTFGEPLPRGIVLESTTDCLSPVSAITTA